MADTVSELGDTYDTSNLIVDGERLTLALDQGSDTGSPSSPILYNSSGYQIAYWDESSSEWLSSDFAPTGEFGNSPDFNAWLANKENIKHLSQSTISSINTNLTEEEQKRYENNTVFGAYNTSINTDDSTPFNTFNVTGVSRPRPTTLWGEKAFSQKSKTLIYPEDHASEEFDFIKITPIEYEPAFGNIEGMGDRRGHFTINAQNDAWIGFKSIKDRYLRTKQVGSTMFLPMVPDIAEQNGVDWGSDSMNALQATAGRLAFNAIGTAGGGDPMQAVRDLLGGAGNAAKAIANNPQIGAFIKAYYAGQAVNANILGRTGIAINPNLEVLFNGPRLRTFTYNFKFTPRTDSEAETIRTIIKVIKKTMAPKRRDKIFLNVPAVYKIKYVFNGDTNENHPFLNKIKPCALSDFSVQYAPDGSYMTYDDGSMTSYNVSMKFNELEPIYNDDINDVDDATTGF